MRPEIPVNSSFLFMLSVFAVIGAVVCAPWLIVALCRRERSKNEVWLLALFVCGFVGLFGFAFGSCNGHFGPAHRSQYNVNLCYAHPCLDPDNDVAYFLKVVTQERTVMKFHPLDFSVPKAYWYEAPEAVWYKVYVCRSSSAGENPEVVVEIPPEVLACPLCPHYYIYSHDQVMRWLGIMSFDVSFSQQRAVFGLFRGTNGVEGLDLKTRTWSGYTLYDPSRPERGAVLPDRVQFIENGTVVLASAGANVLTMIDSNGHENARNIEDEIRANGPETPNYRNLNPQKFVSGPAWNEDLKIIAVTGEIAYMMFDTNLVLQGAIKEKDARANFREYRSRYAWIHDNEVGYRNSHGFKLTSHTVEAKTIGPQDAATTW
jgi:hypothetical protein